MMEGTLTSWRAVDDGGYGEKEKKLRGWLNRAKVPTGYVAVTGNCQ